MYQSAYSQSFKNEFSLKSDNDAYLFYGQDRYYTNGLFLSFRHATNQKALGKKLEKFIYEIRIGQQMFNPITGQAPDPAKHDRPFAGYLFAGGSANFLYKNETILKTQLELGTIGENAFGKEAQELLHKIVGFYEIKGWEYQVGNELSANLSAQLTKLIHRSSNNKVDFSFDGYANIGNTYSGAGIGVLFRAGTINQLFNSAATNSTISNQSQTKKLAEKEFFFYAKPQLNGIIYDATLQGGLFHENSSITFEPKRLVFAQQLGFNYSSPRFSIDYSIVFKSKEVKSTAKAHQFGTISMAYRFGKSE